MADNATCSTCGNVYDPNDVLGTHPFRHPVNGPIRNEPKDEAPSNDSPNSVKSLPIDPILRYVLIEKGLISSNDLTQAEQKLHAAGFIEAQSPRGSNDPGRGS